MLKYITPDRSKFNTHNRIDTNWNLSICSGLSTRNINQKNRFLKVWIYMHKTNDRFLKMLCFLIFQLIMTRLLHFCANPIYLKFYRKGNLILPGIIHSGNHNTGICFKLLMPQLLNLQY